MFLKDVFTLEIITQYTVIVSGIDLTVPTVTLLASLAGLEEHVLCLGNICTELHIVQHEAI